MAPHAPTADAMADPAAFAQLRRDALRECWPWAAALAAAALAVPSLTGFTYWFNVKTCLIFGAALVLLLRALPAHEPHRRFGPANRVTLCRLALVTLLAAGIGEPLADAVRLAWVVVVLATVAALLDALDGPLARASGLASRFGARFDMECDALLVLVLSLLCLHFDKAGAWVVAAGLMRYAFVLAAQAWPWLSRPLPPSVRRKTVCVVQITGLIVCLGPVISPTWSRAIALLTLAALTASFTIDVAWLRRRRHLSLETDV